LQHTVHHFNTIVHNYFFIKRALIGNDVAIEHRESGKRSQTLKLAFQKEIKVLADACNDGRGLTWWEDAFIRKCREEVNKCLSEVEKNNSHVAYFRELPSSKYVKQKTTTRQVR